MTTLPAQLRKQFEAEIEREEISPAVKKHLLKHATVCFRFTDVGKGDRMPVGATRFGGDADLPKGTPWPEVPEPEDPERTAALFLAQINLAELPKWPDSPLPKKGLLSFFATKLEAAPGAFDVRLFPADHKKLVRVKSPNDERLFDFNYGRLHPRKVQAELGLTIPAHDETFRQQYYDLVEQDRLACDEMLEHFAESVGPSDWLAQLLGFAIPSTSEDIPFTLAGQRLGVEPRQRSRRRMGSELKKKIDREAKSWQHLLRINSNDELGTMFTDCGWLFSFIKSARLKQGDFSDVPAVIWG